MSKAKPGIPINRFKIQLLFGTSTMQVENARPDMTAEEVLDLVEAFCRDSRKILADESAAKES